MPYPTEADRQLYNRELDELCFSLEEEGYVSGHVTYVLYMIVARWFKHNPKYNTIAKIRGVLLGTITEFDRREAAKYEDWKIEENGDVDLRYGWEAKGCTTPDHDHAGEGCGCRAPCVCVGGTRICGTNMEIKGEK